MQHLDSGRFEVRSCCSQVSQQLMKRRFGGLAGQIKDCKDYGQTYDHQHWNKSMPDEAVYHRLGFKVQRALRASARIRRQ